MAEFRDMLELLAGRDNVIDKNMYIADADKAAELISELIRNERDKTESFKEKIKKEIDGLFFLFSEVTLENEMSFYERLMNLCSRLSARQKIEKLQNKVVISFGGSVSAGKSMFINAISGIGNKLPVDQKTTTAIPTYIIKSDKNDIHANSVYGYSTDISENALNAMAHEFDTTYGIGFPSFVDSIIVENSKYVLADEIALLDTPGYTKYDEDNNSKKVVSDREKAYEQLSASDYLIWLIDISCGTITEDDLQFISSLKIQTPILIVFTKADLKSETEIGQILCQAKEVVASRDRGFSCYGITAYSSKQKKEYGQDLIQEFFNSTVSGNVRGYDIIAEFEQIKAEMREAITDAMGSAQNTAGELFTYISNSDNPRNIKSSVALWSEANQLGNSLSALLKRYDVSMNKIEREIKQFFKKGERTK